MRTACCVSGTRSRFGVHLTQHAVRSPFPVLHIATATQRTTWGFSTGYRHSYPQAGQRLTRHLGSCVAAGACVDWLLRRRRAREAVAERHVPVPRDAPRRSPRSPGHAAGVVPPSCSTQYIALDRTTAASPRRARFARVERRRRTHVPCHSRDHVPTWCRHEAHPLRSAARYGQRRAAHHAHHADDAAARAVGGLLG